MREVAILDDYQQVALGCANWDSLPADVVVTVFHDHLECGAELLARLQPFEIICVMRERTHFPRELLEQLPSLRLMVSTGRRNAAIDTEAAAELGILVSGTTSPGHATAELTMALMLALARNLVTEHRSVRDGGWQVGLGRDLQGSTLGLIGLGRLGSQVAHLAQSLGMNVIAWSQNLTQERCRELGVRLVDKATLFRKSDFISIHLRLSERTVGLIGAAELSAMQRSSYLINTSRGGIVDEAILIDALTNNSIAGAALDVFDEEPLPAGHPLRTAPNLLLTPHIGYVTHETYQVFYGETVEAIHAYLKGEPIRLIT